MDYKKRSVSPLRDTVNQFHQNRVKKLKSLSPSSQCENVGGTCHKIMSSIENGTHRSLNETKMTQIIEPAKIKRNIVEEYRQKISMKVSQAASMLNSQLNSQRAENVPTAPQSRNLSPRPFSSQQPPHVSPKMHNQYVPIRGQVLNSPIYENTARDQPLTEEDLPAHRMTNVESSIKTFLQQQQPSQSLNFTLQQQLPSQSLQYTYPVTEKDVQNESYMKSLKAKFSNVLESKLNITSEQDRKPHFSPSVDPSFGSKNWESITANAQANSIANALQSSSNGLKMSDGSMQSVFNRIQNLRKQITRQEKQHESQLVISHNQTLVSSKANCATPEIVDDQTPLEIYREPPKNDLSPQLYSLADSTSIKKRKRNTSNSIDYGNRCQHSPLRNAPQVDMAELELRIRTQMAEEFQKQLSKLQNAHAQKSEKKYEELLKKFDNLQAELHKKTPPKHQKSHSKSNSRSVSANNTIENNESLQKELAHLNLKAHRAIAVLDQRPPLFTQQNDFLRKKSLEQVRTFDNQIQPYQAPLGKASQLKKTHSDAVLGFQTLVGRKSSERVMTSTNRSGKSTSIIPLRSQNREFELSNHQLLSGLDFTNQQNVSARQHARNEKCRKQEKMHVKRFQLGKSERQNLRKLNFPALEEISYFKQMHKKAAHIECQNTSTETPKAYIELQKQIQKLISEKAKLKNKIDLITQRLLTEGGSCCCAELQEAQNRKSKHMDSIAAMWRSKAEQTAHHYQKEVAVLKQCQHQLQKDTQATIDKLNEQNLHIFNMIINKQQKLEVEYQNRLDKTQKENKSLNKRVVDHRHALVQQKLQQV